MKMMPFYSPLNLSVTFLVSVLLLLAPSRSALAIDRYVATNGLHTTGDSWANAYTNIQYALDQAGPGDVIYLAGHTFNIATQLLPAKATLTIKGGYEATNTTVLGERNPAKWPTVITRTTGFTNVRLFYVKAISDLTLDGLTLLNGSVTDSYGGGLRALNATNLTLVACIFDGNRAGSLTGVSYGGGLYASASGGLVSNCTFRGNTARGYNTSACYGAGATLEGAGSFSFADCVFLGNDAEMSAGGSPSGGALYTVTGTHSLRNCLLAYNRAFTNAGLQAVSGTLSIRNSTIFGHASGGVSGTASTLSVSNSILFRNYPDVSGSPVLGYNIIGDGNNNGTNNNFKADPLFERPLFYLATNSPALDAGSETALAAGLSGTTTLTNGAVDALTLDLGYHFSQGLGLDLTLFVNPDPVVGNNTNSGLTAEMPLRSITRALELAAPRTRVNLAAGLYTNGVETFPLVIRGKTIQLVGAGSAATVIDLTNANSRAIEVWGADGDVRLEGLTVRRASPVASSLFGGGLYAEFSTLTLRDCVISENSLRTTTANNYTYGGGLFARGISGKMTDVSFVGNSSYGNNSGGYGGGAHLEGGAWVVEDSTFLGNRSEGTGGGSGFGGGINANGCHDFQNIQVLVNTATGPGTSSRGGGLDLTGPIFVRNGSFFGNTPDGINNSTVAAIVRDSILYRNVGVDLRGTMPRALTNNCIGDGNNNGTNANFMADPLFERPLLYLATNSPCVNRGSQSAAAAGLAGYTTQTNGDADSSAVDLGYHHPRGVGVDLTLYVNPNTGNNTNTGLAEGLPLKSITRALELAAPRTRVNLAAGFYTNGVETFPLVLRGKTIQLIGAGSLATVIDLTNASSRAIDVRCALGDVRLEGLTVRRASPFSSNRYGGGLYAEFSTLTLKGCVISENYLRSSVDGETYGGGLYAKAVSGTMDGVSFMGNGNVGNNKATYGGGAYLDGGAWFVVDSVFLGNRCDYSGNGNGYGGGIYATGGHDFKNVLVVLNRAIGGTSRGGGLDLIGPNVVQNATLFGNMPYGLYNSTATAVVRDSILYRNVSVDLGGTMPTALTNNCIGDGNNNGTNANFKADPMFERPLFYLAPNSPCVNRGSQSAAAAGLAGYTTQTNGDVDSSVVDLGYHDTRGLGLDLTLYVNPDPGVGNNNNSGLTAELPVRSITRALELAAPRTRVYLAAGLYTNRVETFPLVIWGKTIQLIGSGRHATVIDAGATNCHAIEVRSAPGDVHLAGLTVRNARANVSSSKYGGGLYAEYACLTMRDCVVSSNSLTIPTANNTFGGGLSARSVSGRMEDVLFIGNTANGNNTDAYGGGAHLEGGGWLINRLESRRNIVTGGGGGGGRGGALYTDGELILRSSLIVSNTAAGAGQNYGGGVYASTLTRLENCTLAHNIDKNAALYGAAQAVLNTIIWSNAPADYKLLIPANCFNSCATNLASVGQNNVSSDPLFINANGGDFRLRSAYGRLDSSGNWVMDAQTSPCLNGGTNLDWMTTALDVRGYPRLAKGIPHAPLLADIGAYEMEPPPPPKGTLIWVQ